MRSVVAVLIAALAVTGFAIGMTPAAEATERPSARIDITGHYQSNWDDVRLTQNGDRVTGTYVCCGGGTIEGRIIEGRTLRYVWRQPGGWGQGVWTIDNQHLSGTWGVHQDEINGGRWDLVRAKRKSQIAN
jgi:hypothetical protein